MKKYYSIAIVLLMLLTIHFSFGQSEENPWMVSLGTNAVDVYPTGTSEYGKLFEDFLNVEGHWNLIPYPSLLEAKRYVGTGFSLGGRLSYNMIKKYGNVSAKDPDAHNYYNADGIIKYNIGELLRMNRFQPFLEIGGGYTMFNNIGSGFYNFGFGFDYLLGKKKRISITLESLYKRELESFGVRHFQHNLSVAFLFDFDSDGDGVRNSKDDCPKVPGVKQLNGCPDADGDGIQDSEDDCPEIPGVKQLNGCPDADGDGIQDSEDKCPEIPGVKQLNGCPDTDGDGIQDSEDKCPEIPGVKQLNGCPDTDGDGVQDNEDKCPEIPGVKQLNGCPDIDGDGVSDTIDECPDLAGTIANNGCPEMTERDLKQIDLSGRAIFFATDKYALNDLSKMAIDDVFDILMKYSNYNIEIRGYADPRGTIPYNLKLSKRRAKSVADYLITKGMDPERIQATGFGEVFPEEENKIMKKEVFFTRRIVLFMIHSNK